MQNSFSDLLMSGESRIENGKRHECEIIGPGKVRYVVKSEFHDSLQIIKSRYKTPKSEALIIDMLISQNSYQFFMRNFQYFIADFMVRCANLLFENSSENRNIC